MQPGKNIKILINYFFGPALFIWLLYAIYRQVLKQPHLADSWNEILASFNSPRILLFISALSLVIVNWGLEAWKWKLALKDIQPLSFSDSFKATLCGVTFSITMPNRVGEYLGRMIYLPEGSRLKTISVTLVSSAAQLLITLLAGCIGIIFFHGLLESGFPKIQPWSGWIIAGSILLLLIGVLLYTKVSILSRIPRRGRLLTNYHYLVDALAVFHGRILGKLVFISFLRFLVFLVQYCLLFYFFHVNIPPLTIIAVMCIVFWVMAIIPTITLVEVWLRGEVMITLMGVFSSNLLGIGFTSVTIWCINLILPAIAGSLLILKHRIFADEIGEKKLSVNEDRTA